MRISKDLAGSIAFKLTEGSREKADALHVEYKELATTLYEQETPPLVRDTFSTHPEWFNTRQRVDFSGYGFKWEELTTTRPIICNGGSSAHLTLNSKIAERLSKYKEKWNKAEKEYKALKAETETALLNLVTFNRIRENIPAAIPFLPPPMSNALVCNFEALNNKLTKQKKESIQS